MAPGGDSHLAGSGNAEGVEPHLQRLTGKAGFPDQSGPNHQYTEDQ
jgi:hypothetical protein